MSEYPPSSTAKVYHGADGEPCSLYQLVRKEPEWAQNIISWYEGEMINKDNEITKLENQLEEIRINGDC